MWSNWTECSSTCNDGVQYRERQCTNPAPKHGGKDCLTIGSATDRRSCFIMKCPGSCLVYIKSVCLRFSSVVTLDQ